MKRRFTRTRILEILIGIAAGAVVILLVGIGSGVLTLPSSSPPSVTVDAAQWNILQGTTRGGFGWFGPSTINITDKDGLPIEVASGGTFSLSLSLSNLDSSNHTLFSVEASSPFRTVSTVPTLPRTVPSGEDDWSFTVTLAAPTVSTNTAFTVVLTVNALG